MAVKSILTQTRLFPQLTAEAEGLGQAVVLAGGAPGARLNLGTDNEAVQIYSLPIAFVSSSVKLPQDGVQELFTGSNSLCSIVHCTQFSGAWTRDGVETSHGSCFVLAKKVTEVYLGAGLKAQLPAGAKAFVDVSAGSAKIINFRQIG